MTSLGSRIGSVALRYGPGRLHREALSQIVAPAADRGPAAIPHSVSRRSRLEAVLFLAAEPLSLRKLAQLANLEDATEARTLLEELRRLYDSRGAAFQIEPLAGGYQLLTRAKLAPWLTTTCPGPEGPRLTQPALETLAVVAYRQPVLRAEVEAIRGVQCGELLRQLMERDLLRIVGRSEELGRPILYGTTKLFLREYGLRGLDDLPRADELGKEPEANGVGESISLAER